MRSGERLPGVSYPDASEAVLPKGTGDGGLAGREGVAEGGEEAALGRPVGDGEDNVPEGAQEGTFEGGAEVPGFAARQN